jgi:hypothetical protein
MSSTPHPWTQARRILGLLILLSTGFLTFHVTTLMDRHQEKEEALAELQHVRHGLLDAGVWAEKIATVISKKVDQLATDPQSRERLRPAIEKLIRQALKDLRKTVEQRIDEKYPHEIAEAPSPATSNRNPHFFEGAERALEGVKRALEDGWRDIKNKKNEVQANLTKETIDLALDWDHLEKESPAYAERILQGLDDPEQIGALKSALKTNLQEFVETTWSAGDKRARSEALVRLGCGEDTPKTQDACEERTVQELTEIRDEADWASGLILALFFAFLAVAWRTRESLGRLDFHLLVGATFVLLAGGLANPMMRIEAKLLEVNLTLLGESLTFTNQVLFHQSKSILDVVTALWGAGLQYSVVAALIALFSVGFPSLKLLSSALLLEIGSLRENRFVRFFALHSGKWSMADVFVIAIFMAYIGFSGILEGQLSQADPGVVTPATNGTSFLPGLHLFTGFCLGSLFVGSLLEGHLKREHASP